MQTKIQAKIDRKIQQKHTWMKFTHKEIYNERIIMKILLYILNNNYILSNDYNKFVNQKL